MQTINQIEHSVRYLEDSHTYYINGKKVLRVINPVIYPVLGEDVLIDGKEHRVLKVINDPVARTIKFYL